MEIATSCIAEAFHVDPADKTAMTDAIGGQNLLSIYSVYEKLKGSKTTTSTTATPGQSTSSSSSTPQGGPTTTTPESESLKGRGNAAMQKKDYQAAVDAYTSALELAPLNPIYLSNRAAAFSAMNDHKKAQNDAEMATAADPKYTKAWSRLGLAKFALRDARGSMEAYQKGIDAEGSGGSEAMKKGFETAKRRVEETEGQAAAAAAEDDVATRGAADSASGSGGGMPDLASLAGMFGGGGGGAGGMPDLGSLMQNPMMRSMAQNMMSNPDMMSNLMNNPALRNMASQFGGGGRGAGGEADTSNQGGGGGGMPDLASLMNDPSIAEM